MYKSAIVTLTLLGASMVSAAQNTTVDLFLVGFDDQDLVGSVIASDKTATTYSIACATPSSDDCGVPPSFTFTQGPSTMHYAYSMSDDGASYSFSGTGSAYNAVETFDVGCVITTSSSAICSATDVEIAGASTFSSATTTPINNISSVLVGIPVTITAGAISTTTSSPSSTSVTAGSSSSLASIKSSSGISSSVSASSTSKASGAAGGTSSGSATSTQSAAGLPMITAKAQWVVGGAAAAMAYAAI